jgi:teichuronic acid biosynthesis glycosyltransferase TuaG
MNKVFFSVVIPCYNSSKTLRSTLDSVCLQTFKNFEVIAVNDGSTDDTASILEEYRSKIPLTIISHSNSGQGFSRNVGIKHAVGVFIAFLDSDDLWFKNRLETVYNTIRDQCFDIDVICNWEYLSASGTILRVLEHGPYTSFDDLLFKFNTLSPSATCVKRSSVISLGGFNSDKKMIGTEDWDLWIRLSIQGAKFYFLKKPLGLYIIHDQNISGNVEFYQKVLNVFDYHASKISGESQSTDRRIQGKRAEIVFAGILKCIRMRRWKEFRKAVSYFHQNCTINYYMVSGVYHKVFQQIRYSIRTLFDREKLKSARIDLEFSYKQK